MLRFFKINVPDRLLFLFLLFIAINLPGFFMGTPLTLTEVLHQQVGRKVATGAMLYKDIWADLAPIPAYINAIVYYLFGGWAHVVLRFLGLVLVFQQAFSFNNIAARYELFSTRDYIPGLIYLLCGSMFYAISAFSPALIAVSFLLPALSKIFKQIRVLMRDDEILLLGFLLGLAALCYLPALVFLVMAIVAFALYSGTSIRQYLLMLAGFTVPVFFTAAIFFVMDAGADFYYNYLLALFTIDKVIFSDVKTIAVLAAIPAAFGLAGMAKMYGNNRYINFQHITQTITLMWLVLFFAAFNLGSEVAPYQLALLLPVFAFYITHFFQLFNKQWLAELSFFGFLLLLAGVYVAGITGLGDGLGLTNLNALVVDESDKNAYSNKRILVFGQNYGYYYSNELATPYLNTQLAERHFANLDNFETVWQVYNNFNSNLPQVIIDRQGKVLPIFNRMPALKRLYTAGPERGTYLLKPDITAP